MTRTLFSILFPVYLFLAFCLASGAAKAQPSEPITVAEIATHSQMRGHVDYYLDPEQTLTFEQVSAPDFAPKFKPILTKTADFGYTSDSIWLRFSVQSTPQAGEIWRLHFRENFLKILDVYQVPQSGPARLLEHHTPDSPFGARTIRYPEVVVGFQMSPAQTDQFFIKYQSGGSSQLSFTVRSEQEFTALAARKTAKNFIYYGMLLLLVLISFAAFIATRQGIFAAYSAYGGFGLLFIIHGDGNAFQYIWPNLPLFNGYASILLGSGLIASGANFARLFLSTRKYHPVLNKLLLALILGELILVASTVVVDTQLIKKLLVLLALFGAVLFTVSGLIAARTRFKEVRFFVIAWTGAVISSAIMTSRHWFGIEISEEVQFDSMRIVFVLDAALMGAAILDRFNQMRHAQGQALQSSLQEARRNLAISGRLRALENKYALAVKLADHNEQRLTDTVHDLRQPLHALRLNIQRLMDGQVAGDGSVNPDQIEETFGYLETLVSKELDPVSQSGITSVQDDSQAPVNMGEILQNVHEMFQADACAKRLDLRVIPSSERVALPALDLMRIVTNLVSNAIKYTEKGAVLFGLRHRDAALWLEVHDTGVGLPPDAFHKVLMRAVRGDDLNGAEGHGLGLSIVQGLLEKHELQLDANIRPSGGTCVRVMLRRAAED